MIQPQELRIGNYVEYRIQDELDERKEWWELSIIDSSDLQILESGIDDDYRAIPLTEEILLKFGFEKRDKINPPFRNYQYVFMKNGFLIGSDFLFHYISGNTELKHVHQLQNLYFALTGEELTFKK